MYKLLFPQLAEAKWQEINLTETAQSFANIDPNPLLDPKFCESWVGYMHRRLKIDFSYGGYLENRENLWRGSYLRPGKAFHLGIDYNVPKNTQVCLPFDGLLLDSQLDEDHNGGWGGKLIFAHKDHYYIFGHLANIPKELRVYKTGDVIGTIANYPENGDWFPHLHVQCTRLFDDNVDGYGPWTETIQHDFPHPEKHL